LGILDTSTVVDMPNLTDLDALSAVSLITVVTLAELSVGPLVATRDAERAQRQAVLQRAEADFEPIPFDANAARALGQVSASLRRGGRKTTARSLDAMIAATAISRQLPIFTSNPDDFAGIDGLEVVPVPVPVPKP
jgi:hypothetical protein